MGPAGGGASPPEVSRHVGKGLRHVAVHGETWLALIGWTPGALKVGVRDRWSGWSSERRFSRLHLIANNTRFAVLPAGRVPNLASRALGPSLRRLSRDIEEIHGHPTLLAETFVDVSRFAGTCHRAANWRSPGLTRGFSCVPGRTPRWRHHCQPKEVLVFEPTDDAAGAPRRSELPAGWSARQHDEPMDASEPRSLFDFPGEAPECRQARGKRHRLQTVLALAVAARMAGYRGGGDRVRAVRLAAVPRAAQGGGIVPESLQEALHGTHGHRLSRDFRGAAARHAARAQNARDAIMTAPGA